MRKPIVFLFLFFLAVAIIGCSTTQKGAGIGAVAGAGLGAIIGHQSGHAGEGALIGGLGGAAAGALIGEQADSKFCPVDGKRYTAGKQYCPEHGVELKNLEK
ncbi:MAG TPA: glycine zipper 2TM domain-containing protein [Candidatus Omnitrophica bacterium]|nr:glycine zipper 2TM domain-containing protein [Candidatus Omnitrophota bacterium]